MDENSNDALAKLFQADQGNAGFADAARMGAKAVLAFESELKAGGMPELRAFRLAETMSELFWRRVFLGETDE